MSFIGVPEHFLNPVRCSKVFRCNVRQILAKHIVNVHLEMRENVDGQSWC